MLSGGGSIKFTEDHSSGAVLQDAGDGDGRVLADEVTSLFANDHGPIVEIADPLTGSFTGSDDLDIDVFAGEIPRAARIRDVVQIDAVATLDAGNLVEIEIVVDHFSIHIRVPGQ